MCSHSRESSHYKCSARCWPRALVLAPQSPAVTFYRSSTSCFLQPPTWPLLFTQSPTATLTPLLILKPPERFRGFALAVPLPGILFPQMTSPFSSKISLNTVCFPMHHHLMHQMVYSSPLLSMSPHQNRSSPRAVICLLCLSVFSAPRVPGTE